MTGRRMHLNVLESDISLMVFYFVVTLHPWVWEVVLTFKIYVVCELVATSIVLTAF